MKGKTYRTVWLVADDWARLQEVSRVSGLSGSALASQVISALVERLDRASVFELCARGDDSLAVAQTVREIVADLIQKMAGVRVE
jgi:hypothetical protein